MFVNSKLGCARLARSLERDGQDSSPARRQESRRAPRKPRMCLKKGAVDLLVCTDVAARGLDIKDVPAVFNFDIPFNAEDYAPHWPHGSRAGSSGLAVSFAGGGNDTRLVSDIEKLIKTKIELEKGVR